MCPKGSDGVTHCVDPEEQSDLGLHCFIWTCLPKYLGLLQYTLLYIVLRMAQSEPSSGVKGKAIYNKNLSN